MITKLANKIIEVLSMGSSYEQTHKDILNSAKESFLKNGYERSNLREICKGAKVTTGAFYRHFVDKEAVFNELVKDVIKQLHNMYSDSEQQYYETLDANEIEKMWEMTEDSITPFIEFIYEHYEIFKLLLMCSGGTSYENFLDDLVVIEVEKTVQYMEAIRRKGIKVAQIDKKELHMLVHAYCASIFEVVMHDYSKEDALKYSRTLVSFFKSGWRAIFGI